MLGAFFYAPLCLITAKAAGPIMGRPLVLAFAFALLVAGGVRFQWARRFDRCFDRNPALEQELIQMYLESTRETLARMRAALEQARTLRRAA